MYEGMGKTLRIISIMSHSVFMQMMRELNNKLLEISGPIFRKIIMGGVLLYRSKKMSFKLW